MAIVIQVLQNCDTLLYMKKLIAFRIGEDLLEKLEARGKNKSRTILSILRAELDPDLSDIEPESNHNKSDCRIYGCLLCRAKS
jgi:hypothetical protein